MSRVFLVSSNVTCEPFPVYPLGMAMVAAACAGRGHQVRQFDFLAAGRSETALEEAVRAFAPEVVGLSLRNIDNVDSFSGENAWYLAQARQLVSRVRRATDAPVVLGGPAFSILPEEILAYVGADYGIVGEGERRFPDLVERLGRGEKPATPVQANGSPLAGNGIGAPLLEPELVRFYLEQTGMLNLQTKRGCPFACTYCSYPQLEGCGFRARPAEAVVEELRRIRAEFGADTFFFTDSVFNDPAGHHLEIAEELLRQDAGIRWCAFFRPQGMGRADLALMKRSGLYALELGTDAASDATLAAIGKGFSFAEVEAVSRACVEERLPCAHYVMFGVPGETPATVTEGLANLARLEQCVVFAFSGIRILPGTDLHAQAVREGVLAAEMSLLKPSYYFSPAVDAEWMNAAILASFRRRRDRIFPPSEGQARLTVMHRFGFRGILWDSLVPFGPPGVTLK
ncbi:MAG: lipid biosynthesis B12-binding/radical SAM protein [Desulfuromonadales bacterium]